MNRQVFGTMCISLTVAGLALASSGCGSHVGTSLPAIPNSTVLLNAEIQSNIDDSWGRYVTLIGNDSTTGRALSNRIRDVLDDDGWDTRKVRHPAGSCEAVKSGETDINFGPATSKMRYFVPSTVKNAVPSRPRAEQQAVFVAIR
ncbi:MAG: hypothetical protein ACJ75I_01925 [Solirubrobacterales bacterium]